METGYRLPPQNKSAEMSVLGAMLLSAEAVDAAGVLDAADFYSPANGEIYQTMQKLAAAGTPVDFVTLTSALNAAERLEPVGGYEYIAKLSNFVPSTATAPYYIKLVQEASRLRKIIRIADEALADANSATQDAEQIAERAIRRLSDTMAGGALDEWVRLGDAVERAYTRAELIACGKIKLMETGIAPVDRIIVGLERGLYYGIGGRPSVGKSAVAQYMAAHLAATGHRVGIFSREMNDLQYANRALSAASGVNGSLIRRAAKLSAGHWERLADGALALQKSELEINFNASSVDEIRRACRNKRRRGGLDAIFIDYLQLLIPDDGKQSREQEVAAMSRQLKILAKDENIAVVALSQLRRPETGRNNPPTLTDFRESGAIEQDLDTAILLHMPAEQPPDNTGKRILDMIVAKQRDDQQAKARLCFEPGRMRFTELQGES